jgi:hypothetical protein
MQIDLRNNHKSLLKQLKIDLAGNTQRLRVKKKTISNLFRYDGRKKLSSREINLSQFNNPLYLDSRNLTLEVQGLATYEQIVDFVLPYGFLPLITPELKHITVGGAIVGIGIEANTYRYGFVHNGLIEADVLLPDGQVVTCSADNQFKDLFYGLANSYGTIGYVLRAKIKLRKVLPYMTLTTERFDNTKVLLDALLSATTDPLIDAIESLVYSKNEMYLTTVRQTDLPTSVISIYGDTIFYEEISKSGQISLLTKDFIFRYDPEWFWNIPSNRFFHIFRKFAPRSLRNSGFYTKYGQHITKYLIKTKENDKIEQLIQDWEVPWKYADALLHFVLKTVDLCGLPIILTPIKVPETSTLYPMKKEQFYLNLGSYSFVKKNFKQPPYYTTKVIDEFCFSHEGIKMLYSTTFLNESEFNRIYNGAAYKTLKKKYDSLGLLPTLFEKVVQSH